MIHTWNYKKTDFREDEEGKICWEEHCFLGIDTKAPKVGFYRMKYDGVPFWLLSLGYFVIRFGKSGYWKFLDE